MGNDQAIRSPQGWLTALELRAVGEWATMQVLRPCLERLPRGDGHTVVVLPGFTADDRSTKPLRDLLVSLGYDARGWGLGANRGPTPRTVEGLRALFGEVVADTGDLSIVGWSLGGIYAREVARELPAAALRQVITMGSPIEMIQGDRSASTPLYERLRPQHQDSVRRNVRESERPPLPVPATAIYTRTDGIVQWRSCLTVAGPRAENVEVYGSHSGLGFNASAVYVVADRLAQPAGTWVPFEAPLLFRAAFPKPADGPEVVTAA